MYRILIVDDEPMALYSTAHAFPWADWGFDPPVLMTEAPAARSGLDEALTADVPRIRSTIDATEMIASPQIRSLRGG